MVGLAVYLAWRGTTAAAANVELTDSQADSELQTPGSTAALPQLVPLTAQQAAIRRETNLHTTIPTRPRQDPIDYTVVEGDSVFGIAQAFGVTPESVLWANYEILNDNPDQLSMAFYTNGRRAIRLPALRSGSRPRSKTFWGGQGTSST
jgi:hypothetical protein